jgi:hypothetical protein
MFLALDERQGPPIDDPLRYTWMAAYDVSAAANQATAIPEAQGSFSIESRFATARVRLYAGVYRRTLSHFGRSSIHVLLSKSHHQMSHDSRLASSSHG